MPHDASTAELHTTTRVAVEICYGRPFRVTVEIDGQPVDPATHHGRIAVALATGRLDCWLFEGE